LALDQRVGRADAHARRCVALIAEDREEKAADGGERPFLDRLHPAAVDADRNLVLRLAHNRARVAADAFSEIDGEPIVGHAKPRIYQTMETRENVGVTDYHEDTKSRCTKDLRDFVFLRAFVKIPHRKCCAFGGSGVRRQKTVCVDTQPAGSTAAITVRRLVALATSRYASRGRRCRSDPSSRRASAAPTLRSTASSDTRNGSRCLPSTTGSPARPARNAGRSSLAFS